uniref:Uncharacterized protein n=1 Tax=Chromera velia CCMP2878 TaxID=1169474 RepID=A0A0G4H8X2_9ALVE|eukprot:Cvel_5928.t1-p1 / transcript=Cvel_5928.t1 / gene=Cvel_5928 / organism=Chromera_velia_CCMP2878 / gene_product=hypothetical protein / transcript_product=hypothetical protein / location=Cvel_scaffold283:81806-84259(+) / protein_length=818 / sequence_SO=supercontig / SO=protein_coding / is_pseudo=false
MEGGGIGSGERRESPEREGSVGGLSQFSEITPPESGTPASSVARLSSAASALSLRRHEQEDEGEGEDEGGVQSSSADDVGVGGLPSSSSSSSAVAQPASAPHQQSQAPGGITAESAPAGISAEDTERERETSVQVDESGDASLESIHSDDVSLESFEAKEQSEGEDEEMARFSSDEDDAAPALPAAIISHPNLHPQQQQSLATLHALHHPHVPATPLLFPPRNPSRLQCAPSVSSVSSIPVDHDQDLLTLDKDAAPGATKEGASGHQLPPTLPVGAASAQAQPAVVDGTRLRLLRRRMELLEEAERRRQSKKLRRATERAETETSIRMTPRVALLPSEIPSAVSDEAPPALGIAGGGRPQASRGAPPFTGFPGLPTSSEMSVSMGDFRSLLSSLPRPSVSDPKPIVPKVVEEKDAVEVVLRGLTVEALVTILQGNSVLSRLVSGEEKQKVGGEGASSWASPEGGEGGVAVLDENFVRKRPNESLLYALFNPDRSQCQICGLRVVRTVCSISDGGEGGPFPFQMDSVGRRRIARDKEKGGGVAIDSHMNGEYVLSNRWKGEDRQDTQQSRPFLPSLKNWSRKPNLDFSPSLLDSSPWKLLNPDQSKDNKQGGQTAEKGEVKVGQAVGKMSASLPVKKEGRTDSSSSLPEPPGLKSTGEKDRAFEKIARYQRDAEGIDPEVPTQVVPRLCASCSEGFEEIWSPDWKQNVFQGAICAHPKSLAPIAFVKERGIVGVGKGKTEASSADWQSDDTDKKGGQGTDGAAAEKELIKRSSGDLSALPALEIFEKPASSGKLCLVYHKECYMRVLATQKKMVSLFIN